MRRLLILTVMCLLFVGCDIPKRLTLKNRLDKRISIGINYFHDAPFNIDTTYLIVIQPKEYEYMTFGWGGRWTKNDVEKFRDHFQKNLVVLGDTLSESKPKVRIHRGGLRGSGMVVRVK